jgi:tetratricopeptide (TPR) repeat protein/mono/diheme cytochrome c family protein
MFMAILAGKRALGRGWGLAAGSRLIGTLLLAAGALAGISFSQTAANRSPSANAKRSVARPNFARDVAPILYKHCAACHHAAAGGAMGEARAFPLITYEDVKAHAADVATAVQTRAMPPWLPVPGFGEFVEENRVSAAQIETISAWVRDGAPEGPAAEIPAAPAFTSGWQLGKPDLVLQAERPLTLPASGADVFWNFIFSPGLKTVRYLRAIEVHPGSDMSLIHHANVVVDRAQSARRQESERGAGFAGMDIALEHSPLDIPGHFLFWKPGAAPWVEPDGLALRLEPGADLVLNAHFMPMGMAAEARPELGLYFTDVAPTKFPMLIELENDDALEIPAGASDFVVGDDFRLPRDVEVLAIYPHAHYLGHAIDAYATLPGRKRVWLIRIRDWNPDWQAVFHYRAPMFLPAGSVISMRWHYDNSAGNPRNPHSPPQRVVGGNQAFDEMAHLWLQVLPRGGDERAEIEEALLRHRVRKYRDDFDARISLGALLLERLEPAEGVGVLRQAVELKPRNEEARRFLGMALEADGKAAEAIEQWRAALEIVPGDLIARYGLARSLADVGSVDEGVKEFRVVVEATPRDFRVRDDFGELLLRDGHAAEALAEFDAVIALEPEETRALRDREVARGRMRGKE